MAPLAGGTVANSVSVGSASPAASCSFHVPLTGSTLVGILTMNDRELMSTVVGNVATGTAGSAALTSSARLAVTISAYWIRSR